MAVCIFYIGVYSLGKVKLVQLENKQAIPHGKFKDTIMIKYFFHFQFKEVVSCI